MFLRLLHNNYEVKIVSMKLILKVFFCLLLFNLLLSSSSAVEYSKGDIVEGEFEINRLKITLPAEKWEVAFKGTFTYGSLHLKGYDLIRLDKDNQLIESINIGFFFVSGRAQADVNLEINKILFLDEYDGCYERPEYYVVEVYHKGSSHNCLVIGHGDPTKALYNPDDPSKKAAKAHARKWIEERNIKLPKMALGSNHYYFSRLSGAYWYLLSYWIDPDILGAPKINNFTEETSEYHKLNIHKYPEHKKTMDLWTSIITKRHQDFEKMIKSKHRHRLNLEKYNPIEFNDDLYK